MVKDGRMTEAGVILQTTEAPLVLTAPMPRKKRRIIFKAQNDSQGVKQVKAKLVEIVKPTEPDLFVEKLIKEERVGFGDVAKAPMRVVRRKPAELKRSAVSHPN